MNHNLVRLVCLIRVYLLTMWLSVGLIPGLIHTVPAHSQANTGAICVMAFADNNINGQREADETPLAGVNVNLATGGAIIATHISTSEQHCFENLLPGIYTVTFTDSPTYRTTTANQGTFELKAGERLTINDFGAFPVPPDALRAAVAAQIAATKETGEPFDTSTRLLLATTGSMMIMIFMVGVGAVILGIITNPRRSSEQAPPPPPPSLSPPPTA